MSTVVYTLKQASVYCGRSESTLRSWIRSGKLIAKRNSDKGNSSYSIEHNELVKTMHSLGILEAMHEVSSEGISKVSVEPIRQVSDSLQSDTYSLLNRLLEQVTKERDRLLSERDESKREIQRLNERIESLTERTLSLERELYAVGSHGKGILGFLRSKFKL